MNNRKKTVIASIIASGTDDLNVMFLSFSMASIIAAFGLSGVQAGAIATITNLGMLIGGLIFGYLGDRHHKLKVLAWTLVLFSVANGLIAFAPSIYWIYLLRFIAGIGVGGEYGIALSIMAHLVPADKMGRIASLNGVAGQVGSIASALLAGLFLANLGWRGLFLFGFAPLLIVAYMKWGLEDEAVFYPSAKSQASDNKPGLSVLFKDKATSYQTLVLMAMATVQIAGYFGMMNWLPTMMQELTGASVQNSSIWMVATILGMSLGMVVFGRGLDYFGPRLMFGLYLVASAVSVYLFAMITHPAGMVLGGAMMGFFVNGMFPGYGAVVSRLYPKEVQSLANNLILNVGRAVGGFSSMAIGFLMEQGGVSVVMIFLASLYLISFLLMLTVPGLKGSRYQAVLNHAKA
ncbi:MFS transporter [Hutsoniella sourekii]